MWKDRKHPKGTLGKKFPQTTGANSVHWKGGVTDPDHAFRKSAEYRSFRKSILDRDKYTCQICGKKEDVMHVDHIKSFSEFPELRLDINNGRVLCPKCHFSTDTYGSKSIRKNGNKETENSRYLPE